MNLLEPTVDSTSQDPALTALYMTFPFRGFLLTLVPPAGLFSPVTLPFWPHLFLGPLNLLLSLSLGTNHFLFPCLGRALALNSVQSVPSLYHGLAPPDLRLEPAFTVALQGPACGSCHN